MLNLKSSKSRNSSPETPLALFVHVGCLQVAKGKIDIKKSNCRNIKLCNETNNYLSSHRCIGFKKTFYNNDAFCA